MCKKLIFLVSLVSILGLVGSASAATVELTDSTLLTFIDLGMAGGGSLDSVTDIAGDPGVQYNLTFGASTGATSVGFGILTNPGFGLTDTWEACIKNTDSSYSTAIALFGWQDGFSWIGPVWIWHGAGQFQKHSLTFSATSSIDGIGIMVLTDPPITGRPGSGLSSSIQVITEPTISLLAPNGGDVLTGGSTYDVNWTSTGSISDVLIELSTNTGTDWNDVNTVVNTGLYEWLVPEVTSPNCLVRISDAIDANIYDTSDAVFTIFECSGPIPGDVDNDCYVNFWDIAIVAEHWLICGNPLDPACGI